MSFSPRSPIKSSEGSRVARIYGMDTETMIDFVNDFAERGEFMDMPIRSY